MKIIDEKIIHTTRFLNLVEINYLNKNGKPSIWTAAKRPNNRRSVLIAALHHDKLVVTKEFRPAIGGFEWSLPAGLVDSDEPIEITASRELKEETNLDLQSITQITPFLFNTSGITNESTAVLFGSCTGTINNAGNEESENIEVFLMTKKEVQFLIERNDIMIGAKAWFVFDKFISGAW